MGHSCTVALCTLNLHFVTTTGRPKTLSGDQGKEIDWLRGLQQAVKGFYGCLGKSQIGF